MRPYVRHEWVGDYVVRDAFADDSPATLDNFAFTQTPEVLSVEPRLGTLASMVERAHPTAEEWPYIEQMAVLLVGPGRSAQQVTPVNAVSTSVSSTLRGAVTLRRYLEALRALTAVKAPDPPNQTPDGTP